MVGQAALQRKHIILTDVPDDYTAVSSGLGETPPRHILVWPIVHEDEVKAVIELGALEAFQDRGLDLLNQVTENIAIALEVAQSRRRLQDLLEQSRAQSESLQAREEELKSSNSLPEWTRHATPSVGSQSATPL